MTDKEELIKIGEKFIREMKLIEAPSHQFKHGKILCSEEPRCAMFYASKAEMNIVAMLEEKGHSKVWHIIKGTYRMNDGDLLQLETYLLASKDFPELEPWDNGGFLAHSYTRNITWDEQEFGDVVIKPHNGGLKRVA